MNESSGPKGQFYDSPRHRLGFNGEDHATTVPTGRA